MLCLADRVNNAFVRKRRVLLEMTYLVDPVPTVALARRVSPRLRELYLKKEEKRAFASNTALKTESSIASGNNSPGTTAESLVRKTSKQQCAVQFELADDAAEMTAATGRKRRTSKRADAKMEHNPNMTPIAGAADIVVVVKRQRRIKDAIEDVNDSSEDKVKRRTEARKSSPTAMATAKSQQRSRKKSESKALLTSEASIDVKVKISKPKKTVKPTNLQPTNLLSESSLQFSDKLEKEIIDYLASSQLQSLYKQHGLPSYLTKTDNKDPYSYLLRAIVYQQLALKAAASIHKRVCLLFSDDDSKAPTPQQVLSKPIDELRSAGLSGAKASYVVALAEKFANSTLDYATFEKMSNQEIFECLIEVKGIGPWSIDIFLMFYMRRMDIMPVGDLGLRKGFKIFFGLKDLPKPQEMISLSAGWQPYRSLGSWYMWQVANTGTM